MARRGRQKKTAKKKAAGVDWSERRRDIAKGTNADEVECLFRAINISGFREPPPSRSNFDR